jgi:hypothetical protein
MTELSQALGRQRGLFALRCRDLCGRVIAGGLGFAEAVDLGYQAALWACLVDDLGDHVVQGVMAISSGVVPPERRRARHD